MGGKSGGYKQGSQRGSIDFRKRIQHEKLNMQGCVGGILGGYNSYHRFGPDRMQ
jgi:hypothetical protein